MRSPDGAVICCPERTGRAWTTLTAGGSGGGRRRFRTAGAVPGGTRGGGLVGPRSTAYLRGFGQHGEPGGPSRLGVMAPPAPHGHRIELQAAHQPHQARKIEGFLRCEVCAIDDHRRIVEEPRRLLHPFLQPGGNPGARGRMELDHRQHEPAGSQIDGRAPHRPDAYPAGGPDNGFRRGCGTPNARRIPMVAVVGGSCMSGAPRTEASYHDPTPSGRSPRVSSNLVRRSSRSTCQSGHRAPPGAHLTGQMTCYYTGQTTCS